MAEIGVLGTGTWGTALTRMLALNGHKVTCWSAIGEEIDQMSSTHTHRNLPGMVIPEEVAFSKDIGSVCLGRDLILFAVPSVFVRSTARRAAPFIPAGQILADVAKGIEAESLLTMSEVIKEEIPHARIAALSGPTHAEEVAKDLPTTIVSASRDQAVAEKVQEIFSNPVMRVYTNSDVLGVELGGALKNIIALASGISAGLGYGDNTKAALITRGLAEIKRLGCKMGCHPETFSGLAGMGDLIVTATSIHSRNNRCGFLIGQGCDPEEAVKQVGMVVEGINAIPAAMELSRKYEVELPIIEAVDQVIHHGKSPREAVRELMGRDLKTELELLTQASEAAEHENI
ncbi:MAG: NAD(P)-dependent glycerol-3-phosphate dehydrogenase [Lachnospiraceae bacterium]|nr:NAD(P)-dependent glycerol-3-phosphate dehydrogenase [Lachnospiraceae bacterium]